MPSVLTEVPGTPTRSLPFILTRPCQVGMMTFLLQLRKRSLRQGPALGPGGYRGGRPARQPPPRQEVLLACPRCTAWVPGHEMGTRKQRDTISKPGGGGGRQRRAREVLRVTRAVD